MPAQPMLDQQVTFTLTVSNQGPAAVSAAGVTLELPTVFSRTSVAPARATAVRSGYFPEPLLWTGTHLQPGATAAFQVVGRFTRAGRMFLRAGVADKNLDSDGADNRVDLIVPVTYSLAAIQSASLAHKAFDALFDPTRKTILATVTGDEPMAGQLVSLNPLTGAVETNWNVGLEPSVMALSDDHETLYVAVDAGTAVAMLNLQTMQSLDKFSLVPGASSAVTVRKMQGGGQALR